MTCNLQNVPELENYLHTHYQKLTKQILFNILSLLVQCNFFRKQNINSARQKAHQLTRTITGESTYIERVNIYRQNQAQSIKTSGRKHQDIRKKASRHQEESIMKKLIVFAFVMCMCVAWVSRNTFFNFLFQSISPVKNWSSQLTHC